MMNRRIVWVILGCLFLLSCISVSGLYTGYEKLTDEQKGNVVKCEGDITQLHNDGRVYKITVAQLRHYLGQQQGEVLVYDYKPHCTGTNCVNPAAVEAFCQQNGLKFCLVACDLDGIFGTPRIDSPLLFMDNEPYGTRIQQKYERRFLEELTGKTQEELGYARYLLFRNGAFVRTYEDYKEIPNKRFFL